jgi:hypothetical protein
MMRVMDTFPRWKTSPLDGVDAVAGLGPPGKSIPHELLHIGHNHRLGRIGIASFTESVVRQ